MSIKGDSQPECPFCGGTEVGRIARFGTAQLVSQYYCQTCKSVFEFIRWQIKDGDASEGGSE
ncbi:hypothetical protein [Brevibacillus fulvus]|uniref:Ribosomal protein L37AE/L43A n=1 Tax=Brevibacillus fulvus TaxID=1125967 RepID=A0A938XWF1_9BACL|nr:hypothetical protein [Brevibacillus fulvus]MBM7589166.1 ribosomal protein L37AE/L43A [Brevibacillus fulvus]